MARRRTLYNGKNYLEVTPVEIQWVTITTPVNYNIRSNTRWNIH